MTTATLSAGSATQLTFPWAQPEVEQAATIVTPPVSLRERAPEFVANGPVTVAPSLTAALQGDRIGQPFRMGTVMFRLLKSYGITDEEIAAGVAAYNARRAK